MSENIYMKEALKEAIKAQKADEVPIGCVIVDNSNGEIIARASNLSQHCLDATAHAEILAIQEACRYKKSNRLRGCDLYVTLEPCTMCAAAISFARIENLYFAAEDVKGGAVVNGVKFYEQKTCHHKPIVHSGLSEEESSLLLKKFFQSKRNKIKQKQS